MVGFPYPKRIQPMLKSKNILLLVIVVIWSIGVQIKIFDSFHRQTFMGMAMLDLFLAYYLYKNCHKVAGIAFGYFSLNSIARIVFPQSFWPTFQLEEIVGFESLVSAGHLYMILILIFFILLPKDSYKDLKKLFLAFAILDSAILTIRWCLGLNPYFLFNNPAIDASFISCCIPLVSEVSKKYLTKFVYILSMALFCAPCILTKTSSGILGLSLFFILSWAELKGLLTFCLVAIVGFIMQGESILNSSGRFNIWSMCMKYWVQNVDPFIGAGIGTFQMYGPAIQIADALIRKQPEGTMIPGFLWMHNDWLQILFETGAIGLILIVALYGISLKKSYNSVTFQVLIIFGAISLIQMPLRHIIFTCLGVFAMIEALRSTEKQDGKYNR